MAEKKVTAPLPGIVKKVLVNAGQKVGAKDAVAVIEAMKMENKIPAKSAGTIKEVFISEGQNVKAGDKLFTIDAD